MYNNYLFIFTRLFLRCFSYIVLKIIVITMFKKQCEKTAKKKPYKCTNNCYTLLKVTKNN